MTEGTCVEVAVPRPVWKTFAYLLPSGMAAGTLEGCRVEVPFGRERLEGWIWKRVRPPQGIPLRSVESRLDSVPAVPRAVLELVRWAADYYAAPPGLMMAAAFPPGGGASMRRMVRATLEVPAGASLKGVPDGPCAVPAGDLAPGYPSWSALMSGLSRLEADGLVETWLEPVPGRVRRSGRMVSPAVPPGELARMAGMLRRKAPAQAAILEKLSRSGEPVAAGVLLRETGASRTSLDAVIRSGAATEVEEQVEGIIERCRALAGAAVAEPEPEQVAALAALSASPSGVFLLHGVTGSGKTEIYLRAIREVIDRGRQAVVLVPEISLTPQLMARFETRFPGRVAVMHSAMSASDRLRSWSDLSRGIRSIAIGPRSAVFAPLARTGIIIVDEEHDPSYKQQEQPRYNARDLAVIRGSIEGVPVILGSATPSLESWGNASSGKYALLTLTRRAGGRPMPVVRAASAPDGGCAEGAVPPEILSELAATRERGEQAILLINRRGFSPVRICSVCGHGETCPECGIGPTFHARGAILRCHHCGWWMNAPASCPGCGSGRFLTEGPGVQKVEAFLASALPDLRVMRLDRDTVSSPGANWSILRRFAEGDADVLLGTQMVAKGHDFPGVTLVGILAADLALSFPDFRASERAFQLVMQASGRAGRGQSPGRVIVQTMRPDSFSAALAQDYPAFLAGELPARRLLGYPPYGHVVRFLWSGQDARKVAESARATMCGVSLQPGVKVFQPAPAILGRLRGRWRYSSIARSPGRAGLRKLIQETLASFDALGSKGVMLDVDVDPVDLL